MGTARWLEVGDRVYCRRYQPWDVTVGVVRGSDGVLVIDTRASHRQADDLRDDLRGLDRRPPLWVVNTHWHFDHTFGNARFLPAQLWGHVSLPHMLATRGGEAAPEEEDGTTVTPPDHLIDERATLDLGDRAVDIRHLGRGHTDGDLVVSVPGAGVMFAGDLVEESGPPAYGDDSFPLEWPATNARLVGVLRAADRVVPGHGAVVDRAFVFSQLRGLEAVARTIRRLWVGEVPQGAALAAGEGQWPWPATVLADAVARGYRELDVSAERGSGG
ncbi:MAG: MBL fold metallo-hydrolase [Actinomycetota bacterium]|nr:MBL fold metallo-hydrolase [Actinomycetota bacterium]